MTNDTNAAAEILAKIGTVTKVTAFEVVDGVLFTIDDLSVVRMNDVDSGLNITRVACKSQAKAEAVYADLVSKAKAVS